MILDGFGAMGGYAAIWSTLWMVARTTGDGSFSHQPSSIDRCSVVVVVSGEKRCQLSVHP
jgi:hypothetical protein